MNIQPKQSERARKRARELSRFPRAGRGRIAVVKGQDRTRWTDWYHLVLTVPWSVFFIGLAAAFCLISAVFALFYLASPGGISHARPGSFWDVFIFSVQTIASINYSIMTPKTSYIDAVVIVEAFFGFLYLGTMTSLMFARFSRPYARVVFSKVAVIVPFDGVPTLMFRAANQRGNQVLEAEVTLSLARQVVTREGHAMRRFEDLAPVRKRTSLFALSWTIMHTIDATSPLHGYSMKTLGEMEAEIVIMLSGTDETLADKIYARHSYSPDEILCDRRFVDVISVAPNGRRIVNLHRFHDTEPL